MFEVKIIKENYFKTLEGFEIKISFFINKGYIIKEFNTVINNQLPTSVVLLIKEDKKEKKARI